MTRMTGRQEHPHCPPGTTVMLFETRAEADRAKQFINDIACGGGCIS